MKIHKGIRDAKQMQLSELEAAKRKITHVMAEPVIEVKDEINPTSEKEIEKEESPKKTRKKKKEENV